MFDLSPCITCVCSRFEADRDKGDFSDLPELHALSSGLKATCTAITAGASNDCLCLGVGYHQHSSAVDVTA